MRPAQPPERAGRGARGFRLEGELRNDARGMDGNLRNTLVFSAVPPGPEGLSS